MLHSQWGQRLQVIGKSKAVLAQVRESDSHKSIFDLGSYASPCKLPGFLLRTWAWKCPVGSPCTEDFWPIDHHASWGGAGPQKGKTTVESEKAPKVLCIMKHPELKPRDSHKWLGPCAGKKPYALGNTERSWEILEKGGKMIRSWQERQSLDERVTR